MAGTSKELPACASDIGQVVFAPAKCGSLWSIRCGCVSTSLTEGAKDCSLDEEKKLGMERKSAEQSHDVLRTRTHPLVPLFAPQTVAVIGATEKEGSVGRAV